MKIKKMSFYAWALIAAMVISLLPVNAVDVKAAATKILDASTLTAEDITESKTYGDFTILGTTAKHVSVTTFTNEAGEAIKAKATDGKEFSGVIKFNGASDKSKSYRMIVFETAAKATVTAYTISNGGERELGLYDYNEEIADGGKTTPLATAAAPDKSEAIAIAKFEIEKAGKYYLASTSGGVNVTYVEVAEEGAAKPTQEVKPVETQPAQTTPSGNTYTVQKGDTLCAIARKLFNAEAKWADIYNWNKANIKDASLIYIGQVLSINGEAAKPAEETKPAETPKTEAPKTTEETKSTQTAAQPTLKFSYDGETATAVPAELASAFGAPAAQWEKAGALRFSDKQALAVIPMTATTGSVKLELELCPASKTAQSIVFKNSAGENVLIIGNNIASGDTGVFYVAEKVAEAFDAEATTAVKSLADIGTISKNSWVKLTVEIDTAKSEAKISLIQSPEMLKYNADYSAWTKIGEVTYKFTNSKADIAGLEIQSTSNARWIGDIALTY